jgi:nanoRNase/pAp phosphatase (c-di-AMP/oligoRNAs hydrolase)
MSRVIQAMTARKHFLILGHANPDEDCMSAMVAVALVLSKLSRHVMVYTGSKVQDNFHYLLNICRYNSIELLAEEHDKPNLAEIVDTIIICDVPKPSMVEKPSGVERLFNDPGVLRIEIDHHLGADSDYTGDPEYRLVDSASSSCEIIGHLAFKLQGDRELLKQYQVENVFSRNLVLALLTGIIGDTQMGKFLKNRREEKYYRVFSTMFNGVLKNVTVKRANFSTQEQVFEELHHLSRQEEDCYNYILKFRKLSTSIGYTVLREKEMRYVYDNFDADTLITVARAVADTLAEESGKLSLVVYYDYPERSNFIQFRARRSQNYKEFDLRQVLEYFGIANGGGHPGAIGFRVDKGTIKDVARYVHDLVNGMERLLKTGGA